MYINSYISTVERENVDIVTSFLIEDMPMC